MKGREGKNKRRRPPRTCMSGQDGRRFVSAVWIAHPSTHRRAHTRAVACCCCVAVLLCLCFLAAGLFPGGLVNGVVPPTTTHHTALRGQPAQQLPTGHPGQSIYLSHCPIQPRDPARPSKQGKSPVSSPAKGRRVAFPAEQCSRARHGER